MKKYELVANNKTVSIYPTYDKAWAAAQLYAIMYGADTEFTINEVKKIK